MQWFQDEKNKHRLIGIAVLLSMVLVILPAMVKKSSQQLDKKMNLSIHVPPKPTFPTVVAMKPKVLFKTIKVAHVVVPDVVVNKNTTQVAHAQSLSGQTMATRTIVQKVPVLGQKSPEPYKILTGIPVRLTKAEPTNLKKVLPSQKTITPIKAASLQKNIVNIMQPKTDKFSVQVASFTQQNNAESLVNKLNKKGFNASYDKKSGLYRVLVGQVMQLDQAKNLQKQLTSTTQLTGFIVKVG